MWVGGSIIGLVQPHVIDHKGVNQDKLVEVN